MASASQPSLQALGIDRLTIPQRMQLLEEIWDSIAAQGQLPQMPEWHQQELDRRLSDLDVDPNAGSSWADAKARLRKAE